MRITVVGGAGAMALGAIRDFVEQEEVERVLLVDTNLPALESLQRTLDSSKVHAEAGDASAPESLHRQLRDTDVCLNATFPRFNVGVMQACLRAGCHYTDFGGLYHFTREQVELDAEFRNADLTAVLGSGGGPGLTQIMARAAADRLDTVRSIKMAAGCTADPMPGQPFTPPYSLETILEEVETPSWQFIDGKHVEMPPLSGGAILFLQPKK